LNGFYFLDFIPLSARPMRSVFPGILVLICSHAVAQPITTFILIRHAEKASAGEMSKGMDTKDPELSEAGRQRALRLAAMLKETKVDAIYSTNYKRTMSTVTPLATAKGITILTYEPKKSEVVDEMLKEYAGGTVVICGHSNTTPWMANYLTGKDELKDFDDSDYDNVLLVEVLEKGKAKVVWLKYP
jgi:broad specificity phosphatase PhoE